MLLRMRMRTGRVLLRMRMRTGRVGGAGGAPKPVCCERSCSLVREDAAECGKSSEVSTSWPYTWSSRMSAAPCSSGKACSRLAAVSPGADCMAECGSRSRRNPKMVARSGVS